MQRKFDRRVKLTENQKEEILSLKDKETKAEVAKAFNVSRRTVDFIWHPEKLERNKELRKERGGSKQYYNREDHNKAMQKTRAYKKELKLKGLI